MKALILVCDCAGAAALVWLLNMVALIRFRRAKEAHWTERARALYPARVAATLSIWILPVDLALAQQLASPGLAPHWVLAALATWVGAVAGTDPGRPARPRAHAPRPLRPAACRRRPT